MDWLTALLFLLLLFLWFSTRRPPNFPPGLPRIPVVGTIRRGSKAPTAVKHLNIVGMFMASYPTVLIQNFKLAKELFSRDEWCGRPSSIISRYLRADSGKNKARLGSLNTSYSFQSRASSPQRAWSGQSREGLQSNISKILVLEKLVCMGLFRGRWMIWLSSWLIMKTQISGTYHDACLHCLHLMGCSYIFGQLPMDYVKGSSARLLGTVREFYWLIFLNQSVIDKS